MKKISIISIISFIFLSLSYIITYTLRLVEFKLNYLPLIIGFVILAISAIIAVIGKKNLTVNIICLILNSIALGFCLKSWYLFRGFDNQLWVGIVVSLACVIYLLVFYLLLYIPFIDRHFKLFIAIFIVLTFIVYFVIIFTTNTTFVSTFGYFVIVEISFIFAMCNNNYDFDELIRNVTISSYSVLIIAVIILLLMLEFDGFDSLDFGADTADFSSPKGKKSKTKKV